ncbi:hypothetical protein HRbin36_01622 [bacterium HR36]|nr:hypothetical protein HRbin36_01622 [bacterium HR36]
MSELPKNESPQPTSPVPRCIHLRCKSMLVYGEDFEQDPEFQAGLVDFWCVLSSRNLGPDGGEVSLLACRDPNRECYQEY